MVIELKWIVFLLGLIAASGIILGVFSFMLPAKSIQLYQRMMAVFNWRAEPINLARELRTTRLLGIAMTVLSILIFVMLFRTTGCFSKF